MNQTPASLPCPAPGELWQLADGGREIGPALIYKVTASYIVAAPVTGQLDWAFEGCTLVPPDRSGTGRPLLVFSPLSNRHSPADFVRRLRTVCTAREILTMSHISIGAAPPGAGVLNILDESTAGTLRLRPAGTDAGCPPDLQPAPIIDYTIRFAEAAVRGLSREPAV